MSKITHLQDVKTQKLRSTVAAITSQISDADLHTLHHDVLVAPARRSILPAAMKEDFRTWLNDGYHPIERESMMAPENQIDTERLFLEEAAEGDDEVLASCASALLLNGRLGPRELQSDSPAMG